MTYRGVEGEWKHVLHAVKRDVIWSVLRSLAQLANPVSQLPPTPTPHTRPSPLTLSSPSPRGNPLLAYAPLLSPTPAAGLQMDRSPLETVIRTCAPRHTCTSTVVSSAPQYTTEEARSEGAVELWHLNCCSLGRCLAVCVCTVVQR
jgi:hypothetical protein